MSQDSLENDPLIIRIKDSVRRIMRVSEETETRVNAVEASMRDSVQTAARNRLSIALRQLRAAYGLSYEDMQVQTGLSQQLLWDIEYKGHRLTLAELNKLAACFDMTASDLLGVDLE